MSPVRVIDVNMGVFEMNDRIANEVRARNKANGTFMVNLMASPGAGKTTTLLRTIADLRDEYKIGVMEADIDASVDAEKMALTDNAYFMHCLPVRRNMIVTDEVIESPQSIVIPEAANRVVSAQTILKEILKEL